MESVKGPRIHRKHKFNCCSTFGAFSMKPSKVSKRVFSSNVINSSSSAVLALKSPIRQIFLSFSVRVSINPSQPIREEQTDSTNNQSFKNLQTNVINSSSSAVLALKSPIRQIFLSFSVNSKYSFSI
jgi:hypothetical protein